MTFLCSKRTHTHGIKYGKNQLRKQSHFQCFHSHHCSHDNNGGDSVKMAGFSVVTILEMHTKQKKKERNFPRKIIELL